MEKEILGSDYLDWLVNVTKKCDINDNPLLTTNDKKVEFLSQLYKKVELYAKENHILPICDGSITSYVIVYNGECLLIREYKIGKNAIYGCSNVTNYKDKLVNNSIDYNDVLNNKKKENRNNIDEGLKALEDNISYLYEQGISEEYLRYAINTFINKKSNDSELVKKKL